MNGIWTSPVSSATIEIRVRPALLHCWLVYVPIRAGMRAQRWKWEGAKWDMIELAGAGAVVWWAGMLQLFISRSPEVLLFLGAAGSLFVTLACAERARSRELRTHS